MMTIMIRKPVRLLELKKLIEVGLT